MKANFTIITIFSLIAMLGGAVNATPTQPKVSQIQQASSTTRISQAAEPLDIPLLVKTMTAFLQSDRYQTESQMRITGGNQGAEFTANVQIKTIVQSGRKFRAEIAFTRPGEPSKSPTQVISDGKQVWIYRPDLRQYAQTSYKAFDKSNDSFWIGLSSVFFLQVPEDSRKMVAQGALSDKNVMQEIGMTNNVNSDLKGDRRTVEGELFYVYNYTDRKEGWTLSAFVQPQTAALQQLQMAGKSEGLDILIAEQILNRTPNPAVVPQTFTFSPPKGTKRVKTLSISPF